MKSYKNIMVAAMAAISLTLNFDMNAQDIKLPKPDFTGGMPFNETVAKRHSSVTYDSTREVPSATLGQLLWAAVGVNREGRPMGRWKEPIDRSNPTALNSQEITAYVFTSDGVYVYEPRELMLVRKVDGDHRSIVAGTKDFFQDFVLDAPVSVVFVADLGCFPMEVDERVKMMAACDAGIACENLNLAAASLGLETRPRATMDHEAIAKLLGLTPKQLPILNNPVGYAK